MRKRKVMKRNMIGMLCLCIALSGCSSSTEKENKKLKETESSIPLLEDVQRMGYRKNEIEEVPNGYIQDCRNRGVIEALEYTAKDYEDSEKEYTKQAKVYLPYGYDEEKTYPVFYLMHGGNDNETWYFGDTNDTTDSFMGCLLDNMIAGGELEPCIVCTPTYTNPECEDEAECCEEFYKELVSDLIPALEGKYATEYRQFLEEKTEDKTDSLIQEAEEKTRLCRGFGGFSMGSLTAWNVFKHSLKEVAFFMPVSGEDWETEGSENQAKALVSSVKEQKMSSGDFRLFAGCGGESDGAAEGMTAMLAAMKEQEEIFSFSEDFSEGNFYYGKWESGGHDVRTVCAVLYNALPQFFEKTPDYRRKWAESILETTLPEGIAKQDEYSDYGKWVTKTYYSSTTERETKINVLLPAYYDKERAYPVLYLLHGDSKDESWAKEDTALKSLLGNMMAQGLTKEMIVVCPYIYCSKENETYTGQEADDLAAYDNFINDLEKDVMPFIEETFSAAQGKENTAIAGFLTGGKESLYIGLRKSEKFGYVGAVCPKALSEEQIETTQGVVPYLIYVAGAKEDAQGQDASSEVHELLEKNSVNHIWQLLENAGQDKAGVEIYLYNYLQMLFK